MLAPDVVLREFGASKSLVVTTREYYEIEGLPAWLLVTSTEGPRKEWPSVIRIGVQCPMCNYTNKTWSYATDELYESRCKCGAELTMWITDASIVRPAPTLARKIEHLLVVKSKQKQVVDKPKQLRLLSDG